MSKAEWEHAYRLAWETYYTPEHMDDDHAPRGGDADQPGQDDVPAAVVLGLRDASRRSTRCEGGYLRRKVRTDRRPTFPIENPLVFYPTLSRRDAWSSTCGSRGLDLAAWAACAAHSSAIRRRAPIWMRRSPRWRDDDLDALEMFSVTEAARAARQGKAKRLAEARA